MSRILQFKVYFKSDINEKFRQNNATDNEKDFRLIWVITSLSNHLYVDLKKLFQTWKKRIKQDFFVTNKIIFSFKKKER